MYKEMTKEELEKEYKESCYCLAFFNRNPIPFEKWLDLYNYKIKE
jgi:hypothetical protein